MKPMIGIVVAVATATLLAPTPTASPAPVYRQVACAPGNQPVSQNFGSPTGGRPASTDPSAAPVGNAAPTRPLTPGTCGCRRGMSAFPKCEGGRESEDGGMRRRRRSAATSAHRASDDGRAPVADGAALWVDRGPDADDPARAVGLQAGSPVMSLRLPGSSLGSMAGLRPPEAWSGPGGSSPPTRTRPPDTGPRRALGDPRGTVRSGLGVPERPVVHAGGLAPGVDHAEPVGPAMYVDARR